jgi:hypothetical protein
MISLEKTFEGMIPMSMYGSYRNQDDDTEKRGDDRFYDIYSSSDAFKAIAKMRDNLSDVQLTELIRIVSDLENEMISCHDDYSDLSEEEQAAIDEEDKQIEEEILEKVLLNADKYGLKFSAFFKRCTGQYIDNLNKDTSLPLEEQMNYLIKNAIGTHEIIFDHNLMIKYVYSTFPKDPTIYSDEDDDPFEIRWSPAAIDCIPVENEDRQYVYVGSFSGYRYDKKIEIDKTLIWHNYSRSDYEKTEDYISGVWINACMGDIFMICDLAPKGYNGLIQNYLTEVTPDEVTIQRKFDHKSEETDDSFFKVYVDGELKSPSIII